MKHFFVLVFLLMTSFSIFGQKGHEIKVKIENFSSDSLYLAYYYGEKQYLTDTTYRDENGVFTFSGDEQLDCGTYLMVLPPNNAFFQVFIDDDQTMYFETDSLELSPKMQVQGSKENKAFYDYLRFLGEKRPIAEQLHKEKEAAKEDSKAFTNANDKLEKLDKEVSAYQMKIVTDNEGSVLSLFIKSGIEITPPETDDNIKRYSYYKEHWFDNLDLNSPCIVRTPVLNQKVERYLEKFLPYHPDTISQGVDKILSLLKNNEEAYQYYLAHLLNKYAASKIVGMDAVYVHIAEEYYAKGDRADIDSTQLAKIVENAAKIKPLLIGKIAPNITMKKLDIEGTIEVYKKQYAEEEKVIVQKKRVEKEIKALKKKKEKVSEALLKEEKEIADQIKLIEKLKYQRFKLKEPVTLHDIESPYTILFIWSPNCGHCKKSMPDMTEFYNKYHDKGVAMYSIGHMKYTETHKVADFLQKNPEMLKWINVTDPFFRSRYHDLYNVHSTPQLYILDKNKEILSKKVGAKQLGEVMDQIIEMDQKKLENEK